MVLNSLKTIEEIEQNTAVFSDDYVDIVPNPIHKICAKVGLFFRLLGKVTGFSTYTIDRVESDRSDVESDGGFQDLLRTDFETLKNYPDLPALLLNRL